MKLDASRSPPSAQIPKTPHSSCELVERLVVTHEASQYNGWVLKKLTAWAAAIFGATVLILAVFPLRGPGNPGRRASSSAAGGSGSLSAGAAELPLADPARHPIGGYPRLRYGSEGVEDAPMARALVLSDAGLTVALASVDVLLVPRGAPGEGRGPASRPPARRGPRRRRPTPTPGRAGSGTTRSGPASGRARTIRRWRTRWPAGSPRPSAPPPRRAPRRRCRSAGHASGRPRPEPRRRRPRRAAARRPGGATPGSRGGPGGGLPGPRHHPGEPEPAPLRRLAGRDGAGAPRA